MRQTRRRMPGLGSGGSRMDGRRQRTRMKRLGMPQAARAMAAADGACRARRATAKRGATWPRRQTAAMPGRDGEAGGEAPMVEPTVRTEFADTALWVGCLATDKDGLAAGRAEDAGEPHHLEGARLGDGRRRARRRRRRRSRHHQEPHHPPPGPALLRREGRSRPLRERAQLPQERRSQVRVSLEARPDATASGADERTCARRRPSTSSRARRSAWTGASRPSRPARPSSA